jgi:hypothetical protein
LTFDGYIEGNDLDEMVRQLNGGNRTFNAAGDLTADGLLSVADWQALGGELRRLHDLGLTAPNGTSPLVSQGTLDYYAYLTNTAPVPEPAAAGAAASAAVGLLLRRRARNVKTLRN